MKRHVLPGVLLLVYSLVPAWAGETEVAAPYKRMFADPLRFNGYDAATQDPSKVSSVVIGLFFPDGAKDPSALSVAQGAQLALEQANARGGYRGVPFELRRRWDDNPWAGGASEMVRLVYEDRVWAVLGSINGASHIAEQVAAKAFLPVVAPISSDPTLTQSRLPWIFRLPPDLGSQARLLVEEGLRARRLGKAVIVSSSDHDGRIAGKEIRRAMERVGVAQAFHLQVAAGSDGVQRAAKQLASAAPDSLFLSLPPQFVVPFLMGLQGVGISCPVYLPWMPGLDPAAMASAYGGTIFSVAPFGAGEGNVHYEKFAREFGRRFGSSPPAAAAYGFDAAQMIIDAIRERGLNRAGVREGLASLRGYVGATGPVVWDNGGGNSGTPVLKEFPGNAL